VIAIGREFNVVPILEFWGPALSLGHLGEALMVVAESGMPEACLLADIYHMHKKGTPHASLNHCGPDTIALVHMNDYPADPTRETITDADRVMPGAGIADWGVIASALQNVGYCGYLSLELFNAEIWKRDPKLVAEEGLAAMKRVME
jgi:sugar phosphate isomerase/epimerase